METEGETGIEMSRPKVPRRLNLEMGHHLVRANVPVGPEISSMSPMTNLVHNLSGASLDSTPKRRLHSQDLNDVEEAGFDCSGCLSGSVTSGEIREDKLMPSCGKENSYSTGEPLFLSSPEKNRKIGHDLRATKSPKVRRAPLGTLDVNSPIKSGFVKPSAPAVCQVTTRLPSIEDVDSQDSGCYPEDSKNFKYPEPMFHRRSLSDRNSICSPASQRSISSSLSTAGSQKLDGATKLDFSFSSSAEDEGFPDMFEDDETNVPNSSALKQLIATPLSEKATKQFSNHDDSYGMLDSSPAAAVLRLDCTKLAEITEKRPQFRRSLSMYDNSTPCRSRASLVAPVQSAVSPVSPGLVSEMDDPGSSPVAPLGLHIARFRMKPYGQRKVIQPVGGPPSKRCDPPSVEGSPAVQESKRRKDDDDDRPSGISFCSNSNVVSIRGATHRIQRCHSETEATIMRALQRSTEEPDLIGDFTRSFALPLTQGKHRDLKCITPQTLVDLLEGRYQHFIEKFTIIDCRYPYEYEHGHVRDAVNLWTKDMIWNIFMDGKKSAELCSTSSDVNGEKKRNIIVFHCEFSSERGPALSRYLRNKDRDDNKDNYPALHWPEIYLLEGGYKAFFELFPNYCYPRNYLPMNQQGHEDEMRRCRAKTKSSHGDGKHGRPLTKSTSRRLELL